MTILIIGGTGQISTSLTYRLHAEGHDVSTLNRGRTSVDVPSGVRCLRGDRERQDDLDKVASERSYDAVIDFVCWNTAHAHGDISAFSGRCGHFIYISTAWVYGPPKRFPVTEDHPRTPVEEYGRNKLGAEELFLQAAYDGRLSASAVRFHATYNDYSEWPSVLANDPTIPYRLRAGKPILVHDRGVLPTHFLHADDAAVALSGLLRHPENSCGEAYNVVGDSLTWDGVFRSAARALGTEARLSSAPAESIIDAFPERTWPLNGVHQYAMSFSNAKVQDLVPEFRVTIDTEEGCRRRLAKSGPSTDRPPEDPDPELTARIDALQLRWAR